ncbi:putative retrotransposon gag domain-containing protein [Helianthus annuus]|uniref:uncharacterized protein LOC110899820 n=1 Tax=Helianthus annuus TaxID=4232 RepID=UPI000B908EAF|nr:uncharacterized protein LOC110899820 [Helianthus annuus]KAJ0483065.1 putative retrotransposon gag domain-containing protein [Helianthus annuus]
MVNQTARLDAHEQQIHQLQSDVAEIKASLTALNEDRADFVEFRKAVLAWMKSQEKKHVDDSSGSGSSSIVFSKFGPKSGSSDPPSGLPWTVKKVHLPEFSGFDPQGWIQKANLFFDLNQTPDASRLQLAQLSMIGAAQHWFTIINQVHPSLTWLQFQSELLQRFTGLSIQNPCEQLATIKQSDSIFDYIDDFEYVLSLVPHLPESQTLGYFIAGLKDNVKQQVRLHRPTTCMDAMYLAKDVDLILRPSKSSSLVSRFRYLSHIGLPSMDSRNEHRVWDTTGSKIVDNYGAANAQVGIHDRGIRSLSCAEWEDRKKKGLCFKYGQVYSPSHKCPAGSLRVLLLGDDEWDEVDELTMHFG